MLHYPDFRWNGGSLFGVLLLGLILPMYSMADESLLAPSIVTRKFTPTFRLRGRIDTDLLWTSQSSENQAIFGDLPDTQGLRRARIGGEGKLTSELSYLAEIDVATGNVIIRDAYFGYVPEPNSGEFRIGHMREPFSLEGGTSANSFAFMERSPINSLDPGRNWGLAYNYAGSEKNWTFAGGVFASGTDPNDFQYQDGATTDFTARLTTLGIYENQGEQLFHLGIGLSERIASNGVIRINQKPRSPLLTFSDSTQSPFTPQITIPANFQQLINLQTAVVNGPFWMQAEWYGTVIPQSDVPPVFYHGSHVDFGYFLTGEHLNYLTRAGVFGPISVHRPFISGFSSSPHENELGYGAWELTTRFAYDTFIDSNAPLGSSGQQRGVSMPQYTAGVNWYLADRLRILFNYSCAIPTDASAGTSVVSLFGMRLAVFW